MTRDFERSEMHWRHLIGFLATGHRRAGRVPNGSTTAKECAMFPNLSSVWRRAARAARRTAPPYSSEVLEDRTILSGVTAVALRDSLLPTTADRTTQPNNILIGSVSMLGIRIPDEFDERRRKRLGNATPPDDLLHGESNSSPSSEVRSPELEIDNADVLEGFEEGDLVQLIACVADPGDDVPMRVGDQQSLSLQNFEGSGVFKRVPRFA